MLLALAKVHTKQSSWKFWVRVLWWLFLLPIALGCWAATQTKRPAKIASWSLAAVAALFWLGPAFAQSSAPTPSDLLNPVPAVTAKPTADSPSASDTPSPSPTIVVTTAPPIPASVAPSPAASVTTAPRPPAPPATRTTAPPAPPPPPPQVGCTHTSTGKCIQGGEFCPVAKEGTAGVDASGARYTCTDVDHNGHPHWV